MDDFDPGVIQYSRDVFCEEEIEELLSAFAAGRGAKGVSMEDFQEVVRQCEAACIASDMIVAALDGDVMLDLNEDDELVFIKSEDAYVCDTTEPG